MILTLTAVLRSPAAPMYIANYDFAGGLDIDGILLLCDLALRRRGRAVCSGSRLWPRDRSARVLYRGSCLTTSSAYEVRGRGSSDTGKSVEIA